MFNADEAELIESNYLAIQEDLHQLHEDVICHSHGGYAHPVSVVHTGRHGQPKFEFDQDFLTFAITEHDTTSLSRYLGVSRSVLARALQDLGLCE